MGGKERQRKSSFSLFSIFKIFKFKKQRGGYYDAYDDGMKAQKIWPSDEDRGRWGVADPGIDKKAEAFITHNKIRVSQSE